MEVLLIRHGQSANNAQPPHLRVPDPGLTEIGEMQAVATAAWLHELPVDYLYCSPFTRSLQTMRPIAKTKRRPVRVRGDLCEQGGCYSGHERGKERGEAGLGHSQLSADYPGWEIDETISEAGWWGRAYETFEQATLRARQVVQWLETELVPIGGSHALVIHADFKRLLIEAMLTPDHPLELAEITLFNAGISSLEWQAGKWQLHCLNSTQHLNSRLVT